MNKFFTVSSMDGTFTTLDAALDAYRAAGRPQGPQRARAWITEHAVSGGVAETVRTVTLAKP